LKEVVEDEMASDTCSGMDGLGFVGKEVSHVCDLEEEQG